MGKIELLMCPYCGNKTDFSFNCYELHPKGVEPQVYEAAVQCLSCDLQTASSINSAKCLFYTKEEAKQAAADIWNRFVREMVKPINLLNDVLESWGLGYSVEEKSCIYIEADDFVQKYKECLNGKKSVD